MNITSITTEYLNKIHAGNHAVWWFQENFPDGDAEVQEVLAKAGAEGRSGNHDLAKTILDETFHNLWMLD